MMTTDGSLDKRYLEWRDGPLDERYLEWLYSLIGTVLNRNPARSHWLMAEQLYKKEFIWFVPNDDNRLVDGISLREEFIQSTNAERDQMWLEEGCSFLEMLIALCRRLEFESRYDAYHWFWKIIDNLGLSSYVDEEYDEEANLIINEVLDQVIERTYHRSGFGGLFPLQKADKNQREVEIWYQMSSYLIENEYD